LYHSGSLISTSNPNKPDEKPAHQKSKNHKEDPEDARTKAKTGARIKTRAAIPEIRSKSPVRKQF
jgi:hypothetical protein